MTGQEFRDALKAAGLSQGEFAAAMGVHRTTIGERFKLDAVEPYWVFALAGLVAVRAAKEVIVLVGKADSNTPEMSAKPSE